MLRERWVRRIRNRLQRRRFNRQRLGSGRGNARHGSARGNRLFPPRSSRHADSKARSPRKRIRAAIAWLSKEAAGVYLFPPLPAFYPRESSCERSLAAVSRYISSFSRSFPTTAAGAFSANGEFSSFSSRSILAAVSVSSFSSRSRSAVGSISSATRR